MRLEAVIAACLSVALVARVDASKSEFHKGTTNKSKLREDGSYASSVDTANKSQFGEEGGGNYGYGSSADIKNKSKFGEEDRYHGYRSSVDMNKSVFSEEYGFHGYQFSEDTKIGGESVLNNEISRCEDAFTCVQLQMLANVSAITIANRPVYNLTENVILERVPGVDVGGGLSELELQKLKRPDRGGFGYLSALIVDKTLNLLKSHSLRWAILPGVDVRVFRKVGEGEKMEVAVEVPDRAPRTFGGPRKRLVMLLLPLMYKMGVMTTMLAGLTVLTLKGLTIGVILLILAVGNLASKHKHYGGGPHHGPTDIHVHVHTEPHAQAYSGWQQTEYPAHHAEYPAHHAEYPPHYRRKWSAPPQQPISTAYSGLL